MLEKHLKEITKESNHLLDVSLESLIKEYYGVDLFSQVSSESDVKDGDAKDPKGQNDKSDQKWEVTLKLVQFVKNLQNYFITHFYQLWTLGVGVHNPPKLKVDKSGWGSNFEDFNDSTIFYLIVNLRKLKMNFQNPNS